MDQLNSLMQQGMAQAAPAPNPPAPQSAEQAGDATVVVQEIAQAKPTLGRYEILEELGRGAMGIVYKGRDPKLGRLTAIKTIRFTDDFDEDQVQHVKEQFYREAEVVARLSHPNIVTIYDVGEDLELSYLAMEYLEGDSLEKSAEKGNLLTVRKCIAVVTQVCDALDCAHNRGIVHRDIKPANIMVLNNGIVKVTDFGIARATATSKTKTGVIKGTPYYMSPEQISGMKVDGRSDIFSLGVVFYQLLTGELPFSGENLAAIMYQITSVPHEPPTKYNPKIFKAAVAILDRALEKKLERRYQTAKQMGDHLRLLGQKIDEVKARKQ
jgi:serine/threonine-protein kinase